MSHVGLGPGEAGSGCVNMAARGGRGGVGRGGMGGGVGGSGRLNQTGRGGIGGGSPRLLKLFGASANLFIWRGCCATTAACTCRAMGVACCNWRCDNNLVPPRNCIPLGGLTPGAHRPTRVIVRAAALPSALMAAGNFAPPFCKR